MNITKTMLKNAGLILVLFLAIAGCNKTKRPALGDYPADSNPPGGPLKFYAAYDGVSANPLMNGVDSIRANFPSENPLLSVDGVSGKGIKGDGLKAIKYPSANDFKKSTQDHWVEYIDNFNKPLFDGNWHLLTFTYDGTTSTVKVYYDGGEVPLPPGAAGNFAGLGPLTLGNASNLVVGGWNKHAGLSGPTDSWISAFTGKMDQFRLYNKVLSSTDILALYNSKQ